MLGQRAQLVDTEQVVLLDAVTAYMDVWRDEAVLRLNINNEEVLRRQLQAVMDRFEVGEITRTDVAQAESRLSRATAQRVAAEGLMKSTRDDSVPVQLHLADEENGWPHEGRMEFVDNQVDQLTGTIKLKAEFPNPELQLWPGQFVNVRLLIDTLRNVVVVPTAAVQRGPSGPFVYVAQPDNTAVVRPVTITQQPRANIVTRTQYVTLTVTATGSVVSYQWYEGAAGVITKPVGTNSSSLTVLPGTTKSYWVRVNGGCGYVDSAVALQSVRPDFTTQPVDALGCQNAPVTFTAEAWGDPATVSYKWFRRLSSNFSVAQVGGNTKSISITASEPMEVWAEATSWATCPTRMETPAVTKGAGSAPDGDGEVAYRCRGPRGATACGQHDHEGKSPDLPSRHARDSHSLPPPVRNGPRPSVAASATG